MQAEKVERLERVFGKNTLKPSPLEDSDREYQVRDSIYYESLLGRKLDRFESIAAVDEADDLYLEAAIAYVALGFGVQIQDFSTSLRRIPSMREAGYNHMIKELSLKYSISLTSESCPTLVGLINN